MKLSAFLAVSLPIVAISQMPALAGSEAIADTGAWLKESIATLKPVKAAPAKAPPRKVSHAAPTAATMCLRPFMPNRYLPKERDMRQALMSQQAQYDPSAGQQEAAAAQPLSGNVSTFYAAPPSSYDQYSMQNSAQSSMPVVQRRIKTAKKPAGTRAPRMTPGQMPVVPEQLVQAPQITPLIPEPPVQRNMRPQFPTSMPIAGFSQNPIQQMQMMQQQQMSQQQMQPMQMQPMQMQQMQQMQMQQMQQQQTFQRPMPMQLQPPKLTVQQQASLDRMVEQNPPPYRMNVNGEIIGAASDNPDNGAGQPPFPLNLMPMNALMQGRHKANVAQARFGSWHGNPNLPSAGFHTWLPVRTPMHFEYSRAPLPSTRRKVTKKPAAAVHQSVAHSTPTHSTPPAMVRPMLASYPVYTTVRGAAY